MYNMLSYSRYSIFTTLWMHSLYLWVHLGSRLSVTICEVCFELCELVLLHDLRNTVDVPQCICIKIGYLFLEDETGFYSILQAEYFRQTQIRCG